MGAHLSYLQKENLWLVGLGILLLIVGVVAVRRIQAGPPKTVVFAAGPRDGAYYRLAQQYSEKLEAKGLEVKILATGGSLENLRLLEKRQADIAFVQSGLGANIPSLSTLGSVYPEPLWLFCREPVDRVTDLHGKTVAIGDTDSGTREVALAILGDAKMSQKLKTVAIGGAQAEEKLLAGDVDAAFYVGSASVASIRTLATHPDIHLADFERVQAYARYHSSLTAVTLYAGMLDLGKDIPPRDTHLLATTATLVVSDQFHYALVTLFLQTAQQIHQAAGPFREYGEFPSPRLVSLPLLPEAEQFYQRGPSFFFRHLPFYFAAAVDRLLILLLPLLTLLLPLMRFVPPVYGYFLKRQLFQRQEILQSIELDEVKGEERAQRLADLERELPRLKKLPPAYQNEVFLLQLRLERVKQEIEPKLEEQKESSAEAKLVQER